MGSIPGLGRSPRVGNGRQPTPVFLPGKFCRQKSLEGCSPWDHWARAHHTHTESKKLLWTFVVQSLCRIRLFVIPWTATHQASLSFTISQRLLRLMSIELVMASSHLILYHPLLLLPSVFPSIRVFSNKSALRIRWPNVLELQLHHPVLPMNIQGWFPLGLTGLILLSKGLSRVFSSTTIWKQQFFCTQPSLWSNSHLPTWLMEKP